MIWLLWLPVTLAAPRVFPLVDPGLFVISGVKTCGGGGGYCLLGLDCTLDEDFLPDDEAGHHCEGLRSAFTPSAHFVCCRATNRSLYKPPLVLPAGLTTAFTEAVTGRTTAADVLENEIDQVLLKVAQSVDAIKKTPATEATAVQADDQTPELRESAEDSVEDGPLEDEDSLLDSIEDVAQQDMSIEEEDPQESIPGGDVKIKVPLPSDKSPVTENKPMDGIDSQKPVFVLDESENYDLSAEKSTEDNMISTESLSDESASEEIELLKNASITLQTNENLDETKIKEPIYGDKQETTVGVGSILNENTNKGININKPTNSANAEDYSENKSSNENLIQNDEAKVSESNGEGINTMIVSEKEEYVTRLPDLSADIASLKNETNLDSEWVHSKISVTPKLPLENVSNDQADPSIVSSGYNNTVNKTDSKIEKVDNLSSNEKKDNSLPENVSKTNSITVDGDQSAHAEEDQFVTSTTVSPATHIPDNGRPMSTGQVIQGHPGMDQPCSRGASRGENCSEEVKFIFQNKTICFGSVYALDWVVTSASCALRVFRAGMLNVSVIPLSGPGSVQVKTIIVHESYGENAGSSGQEMEANNIGLVQLKSPVVQWAECVPCLPLPGHRFSTSNCTAVTSRLLASVPCSTHGVCKLGRDAASSSTQMPVCAGSARMMTDDRGFPYIILPCDMVWEPRFAESSPRGSGAPLFCEGVLAGLETSAGVGMTVYTPLSPYLGWLLRNTRPGLPDQHFNVG
ncbi:uncharacterized protein LOC124373575 [Homalodisca vitripennis]|uniref:uncharacterized protein LOC124373575 n=1 Tax=Homalodisca vitripennis TaxID=197043 RepID=UPI001EECF08E|nr:uncharacterized protein LOC124373575 [Homalodisca vitripennis]